ncbi:Uma2 family endonuclease [Synechocystis salina]|uniref:Uma2 family endonuclease n=1 Tax=Synechocystis salina LEGE 00031 TaxID=1828736 RepID=A0ABR9VUS1_9SYNC|nr:Uma2 family endonuclease [Synechocystis salina]MBE9241876.1 Uma2 family endonuclease [Synechocystis salina LEGE 00041]MBE9255079.1 Uma2 family endonuclease [Synechocystis salina LEGE 00031]
MITSTPARITENRTLLTGIRWQTYQDLLLDLAENPSKRLTYDQGLLEIMTPLPEHEASKRLLGRLVESTTEELGLEIYSLGSTTWRREDLQKGLEPDECYYITQEAQVRGKTTFDLNTDPAPDLAIEIDLTSSSLNRLSIYAALGVREIWRYDGQDLKIYILVEGEYQQQEQSSVLPILSRSDVLVFLNKRSTLGENALIREFRQWLHQQD